MKALGSFIKGITLSILLKKMVPGALIGLALISFFIFSVDNPDPTWGNNWRVRPLILTPLVSAFGMLAFLLKDYIQPKTAGGKITVFLISTLAFIISLWMGIIIGLDGTLWN